ncbi:MAG: hypothetical protein ABH811_02510 [archaeon]
MNLNFEKAMIRKLDEFEIEEEITIGDFEGIVKFIFQDKLIIKGKTSPGATIDNLRTYHLKENDSIELEGGFTPNYGICGQKHTM